MPFQLIGLLFISFSLLSRCVLKHDWGGNSARNLCLQNNSVVRFGQPLINICTQTHNGSHTRKAIDSSHMYEIRAEWEEMVSDIMCYKHLEMKWNETEMSIRPLSSAKLHKTPKANKTAATATPEITNWDYSTWLICIRYVIRLINTGIKIQNNVFVNSSTARHSLAFTHIPFRLCSLHFFTKTHPIMMSHKCTQRLGAKAPRQCNWMRQCSAAAKRLKQKQELEQLKHRSVSITGPSLHHTWNRFGILFDSPIRPLRDYATHFTISF